MISQFAKIAGLAAWLVFATPATAGQYEAIDYHVQQMIAQAAANDATGVQTFREQLENLPRPEAGDSAQAKPLYQQGMDHLAHNNSKAALAALRQAFITDPADPEIASQLGGTYLRQSRFKEAERLSVYALSLAPTQSTTWFTLGQIYGQTGDANRATGAFANAYRFAQDQLQLAKQLQQLATSDTTEAARTGARQALQLIQPATSPQPVAAQAAPPSPGARAGTLGAAPAEPTAGGVSPSPSPPTAGPKPPPDPARPPSSAASRGEKTEGAAALGSPKPSLATLENQPDTAASAARLRQETASDSDNPGQRIYQRGIRLTCLIVTFHNGKPSELGSGLLVSEDGLVITNNHVIEKADNLAVKCGERESTASVRKRRNKPDLALLATSIKSDESFTFNKTYNQDLIGRDVFVIGNPYGLEGTFSTGIISGLREIEGTRYIQISAPVSPGNSGGPVILRDGSVIGIAALGLKQGQNLNFAIAAAEVVASDFFDSTRMKSQSLDNR